MDHDSTTCSAESREDQPILGNSQEHSDVSVKGLPETIGAQATEPAELRTPKRERKKEKKERLQSELQREAVSLLLQTTLQA